MKIICKDFNGAEAYFSSAGATEWRDIRGIAERMPVFLHPSDQRGRIGTAIFDPKGTNDYLTREASALGWAKRSLPADLRHFGVDVDAGKGGCIAEWQFSNYPFLWNNLIRAECIRRRRVRLESMGELKALIVVTKVGAFRASNSTLYYEQAQNQIDMVLSLHIFGIAIRLVGLTVDTRANSVNATVSRYGARYRRVSQHRQTMDLPVSLVRGKFDFDLPDDALH